PLIAKLVAKFGPAAVPGRSSIEPYDLVPDHHNFAGLNRALRQSRPRDRTQQNHGVGVLDGSVLEYKLHSIDIRREPSLRRSCWANAEAGVLGSQPEELQGEISSKD